MFRKWKQMVWWNMFSSMKSCSCSYSLMKMAKILLLLWPHSWVCSGVTRSLPLVCFADKRRSGWIPVRSVKSPKPTPMIRLRSWSKMERSSRSLWFSISGLDARKTPWPVRRAGIYMGEVRQSVHCQCLNAWGSNLNEEDENSLPTAQKILLI